MPEIQLGSHIARSRGVKLARTHMHDWIVLVVLNVIEAVLLFIEPFHSFVGEEMMKDLKYPLKDNTVPFWAVPIITTLIPSVTFLAFYFIRRDIYDLHHAILGLLSTGVITAIITDAIKDAVGWPRPDFFWRCFPDGKGVVFHNVTGDVLCTEDKKVMLAESRNELPSSPSNGNSHLTLTARRPEPETVYMDPRRGNGMEAGNYERL
ncbi:hypothetical protein SAY87_012908 [Trapa incisa]|uniref:Lipid phosphate phosphatase 2 n=1 Tax=Trapa incisa TaxID=236973 RepID=A0AAN7KA09_9MYRT|nr:hypothetical protein SAY87_012908 [Trapa incisa]